MKNTQLKEFAKHIIDNGVSKTEAKKIMSLLTIQDLKVFERFLRQEQEKQTVYITVSEELDQKTNSELTNLFKNKRIVKNVDSKIGGGINARVYDMIYDLSIKKSIERVAALAQEEI